MLYLLFIFINSHSSFESLLNFALSTLLQVEVEIFPSAPLEDPDIRPIIAIITLYYNFIFLYSHHSPPPLDFLSIEIFVLLILQLIIQQIFIKHLLCASHTRRCRFNENQIWLNPCSHRTYSLVQKADEEMGKDSNTNAMI